MKFTISIFSLTLFLSAFAACKETNRHTVKNAVISIGDTVMGLGKNIDGILQDKNDRYWFASNGEGVYCYDGKTMRHITDKDGLCSNYVWGIQEDVNGKLWFGTRDGYCCFDGKTFINYTDTIKYAPYGLLKYQEGGIFFNHTDGICFYDGKAFTNFTIHPISYSPEPNNMYRPYGIYCAVGDKQGNVWLGTQEKGVCRYDGKSFSFITGKDLNGPAVRSVFQAQSGMMWFGNNGGGLYRYDGKTLSNITEERNLGNTEFLKGQLVDKPGSMARVFAINEDKDGALWIGTVDAGVWKMEGTKLTNYTNKDGLSGNSVPLIYKDRKGELWFVSNGDAVCRFNGQSFSRIAFK